MPSEKRPVPLQTRRRRHDLQPLSTRLLGLHRGGLQALCLPTQLRRSHRPVFDQVGRSCLIYPVTWDLVAGKTHNTTGLLAAIPQTMCSTCRLEGGSLIWIRCLQWSKTCSCQRSLRPLPCATQVSEFCGQMSVYVCNRMVEKNVQFSPVE